MPGEELRALLGLAAPKGEAGSFHGLVKASDSPSDNTLWGKAIQTFMGGMENVSQSALQMRKK